MNIYFCCAVLLCALYTSVGFRVPLRSLPIPTTSKLTTTVQSKYSVLRGTSPFFPFRSFVVPNSIIEQYPVQVSHPTNAVTNFVSNSITANSVMTSSLTQSIGIWMVLFFIEASLHSAEAAITKLSSWKVTYID